MQKTKKKISEDAAFHLFETWRSIREASFIWNVKLVMKVTSTGTLVKSNKLKKC